MSVETFDVNQPRGAVTVTPAAADHFGKQLADKGGKAVRVSLKKSGCTGYMYVIDEVDAPQTGDAELKLENGVTVYISEKDLPALQGSEIDYAREGLNRKLVVNNPNAKDACGCGESFNF